MAAATEPYYTLYQDGHRVIHYVHWTVMANSGRFVLCHPNDDAREYMHFARSEVRYPTCITCVVQMEDPACC